MKVHRIPAFDDNYLWIAEDANFLAAVDPGDALPILQWLQDHKRVLTHVLITHHHADHVGGVEQIVAWHKAQGISVLVLGPEGDAPKIHFSYQQLKDGEYLDDLRATVMHVPGHTLGHIAYYFGPPSEGHLFCGDTLFAMGCGRLFEGTAAQMATSLARLAALPDSTIVYCAHEYTLSNCRFALHEEPNHPQVLERAKATQEARDQGIPTVPFLLGLDKLSNPFLRAQPADFAALRRRKDNFR